MSELEISEIFKQLDSNIRELLSLVHSIKIDRIIGDKEKAREDLVRAQWLAQKINEMLYELG